MGKKIKDGFWLQARTLCLQYCWTRNLESIRDRPLVSANIDENRIGGSLATLQTQFTTSYLQQIHLHEAHLMCFVISASLFDTDSSSELGSKSIHLLECLLYIFHSTTKQTTSKQSTNTFLFKHQYLKKQLFKSPHDHQITITSCTNHSTSLMHRRSVAHQLHRWSVVFHYSAPVVGGVFSGYWFDQFTRHM